MKKKRAKHILFLAVVFLIALSGIAYELIAGTAATYLLGQSVTQFSFATGWFLAAMGLGAWYSRNTKSGLLVLFVKIQILLSLLGGFSSALLFLAFNLTDTLYPVFMLLALVIGTAIGFEVPLILRLVSRFEALNLAISEVLTWDYVGALFASILFPLVLLPHLGLIQASLFFGGLNLLAGWMVWNTFKKKKRKKFAIRLIAASFVLSIGFLYAEKMNSILETSFYQDPVIYANNTKFQRVILTRWKNDLRLYLDGELQFSTKDEKRYHESLVHIPILLMNKTPENVLILGGGDGIAARELLKYNELESVTIIDIDPDLVKLFKTRKEFVRLNNNSLNNVKVRVLNEDAFQWLKRQDDGRKYDLIIIDFPDPNNHSLGKLYSTAFYKFVSAILSKGGAVVTQATSPVFAGAGFQIIRNTVHGSLANIYGENTTTRPYHIYIPSFGDWGFIVSGYKLKKPEEIERLNVSTEFLNIETVRSAFAFSKDLVQEKRVNTLNNQILVKEYENAWTEWFR